MGRILTRYILREISIPFLLSLLIFTSILFTARILKLVDLVINRGVSILQIGQMLFFVLPSFFEVTVPMALLLGILWGFGRFASDKEVVALKSCGMSLVQLAVPVCWLSLLLLVCSYILTLGVRPWSNSGLDAILYEVATTRATAGIKEKTFSGNFEGLILYAEEIEPPGTLLRGVMMSDRRKPERMETIFAKKGLLVPNVLDNLLTLRLTDGTLHSKNMGSDDHQTTHFSVYDVTLDTAALLASVKEPTHSPKDMRTLELISEISQMPENHTTRNKALVEYHRRLALPFACVVFSLIGLPLSVRTAWAFRSVGFASSLGIILFYYVLLTAGETLGKRGVLPPALALWAPNVILGGVGVFLFLRVWQEKPILPLRFLPYHGK